MLNTAIVARRLLDQFLEALQALPQMRVETKPAAPAGSRPDQSHDAEVRLRAGGKAVTLLVEVRKELFPRDARQVLWRLKELGDGRSGLPQAGDCMPVLVVEALSPGAKDLLRNEGVGYFDSGGSLFLPAPGAYLYVDKPPSKAPSRSVRSLFAGRRARVLHALLMRHKDWFGVTALAAQAQVSPATASQALAELERFDWLESRGSGPRKQRYLCEPAALLDEWTRQLAAMRPPALRRYYVPGVQVDGLVEKIDDVFTAHAVDYALTHEAAGQRYAPFLSRYSQVRCRVLMSAAADRAIDELGARSVNEGFNFAVIEAGSAGDLLFRQRVGGSWLASAVQVYLDLLRSEGRAKELAEHLRREEIGF